MQKDGPVARHKALCSEWPIYSVWFFLHGATAPSGPWSHYWGFTITLRHIILSRTPLDERLARCRGLYLTTRNTRKTQTSVPLVGFKPTIPASEQLQTHALDCAATGIGDSICYSRKWVPHQHCHKNLNAPIALCCFHSFFHFSISHYWAVMIDQVWKGLLTGFFNFHDNAVFDVFLWIVTAYSVLHGFCFGGTCKVEMGALYRKSEDRAGAPRVGNKWL
jgi:hypothetical protein